MGNLHIGRLALYIRGLHREAHERTVVPVGTPPLGEKGDTNA